LPRAHVVRRATLSIPGAIVWAATSGNIDETVTNRRKPAQRWRGETLCNRMQIQTDSIDIERGVVWRIQMQTHCI
jgi:hypothetical protein